MVVSTAFPRTPSSLPNQSISSLAMANSHTIHGQDRKPSVSSIASYQQRPGSSASVSSRRVMRLSSGTENSQARAIANATGRSVSVSVAGQSSTTSISSLNGMKKKISVASFPQPPSAATSQRHASYSMASAGSRSPRSSMRPAARSASKVSLTRISIPRASSASITSTSNSRMYESRSSTATPGASNLDTIIDDSFTTFSPTKTDSCPQSPRKKEAQGNVTVSVRVRGGEKQQAPTDGRGLEWAIESNSSSISYRGKESGSFSYDNVFKPNEKNDRVYEYSAKRLVRRVMEGYHGTVFAYGMTGTGKTYSMQGTAASPGIIPLAITDIFAFIRETPHREFLLRVSYLEIYNEKIYDLLSPTAANPQAAAAPQEEIKIREDNRRGVYATPLKEEIVQSPTQLLRVISRGDSARRTASTIHNNRSSRSHAVVQVVVESRERVAGASGDNKRSGIITGGVRVSTLSLIDLAGSERAAESKERRAEGAHINKSLLTLGTVISRLSERKKKDGTSDEPAKHLPYRDSKLTRLLQPALSGNSLVSILCTAQLPLTGQTQINETLNTLKFANRARNNIVSNAKKSEEAMPGDPGSRALLDRYRMEIIDLRKQLEEQKQLSSRAIAAARRTSSHTNNNDDDVIDPQKERERMRKEDEENQRRHDEQISEMQLARTALKERIEHLNRLILSSKSLGVNTSYSNERSYSSMSYRNHSALGLASAASFNLSRGISRLSTNSYDHPHSMTPSVADSYNPSPSTVSGFHSVHHISMGDPPSRPRSSTPSTDSLGSNGDGTASLTAQVRALHADLADRNRYIDTLERRLVHARRTSQSKVLSAQHNGPILCPSCREGAADGIESLLREKDEEIRGLKARLDDKDRMFNAIRNSARKNLMIDTYAASQSRTVTPSSASSPPNIPLPPLTMKRDSTSSLASNLGRRVSGTRTPIRGAAGPIASSPLKRKGAMTNSVVSRNGTPVSATGVRKPSVTFITDSDRTLTTGEGMVEMNKLLDKMQTEKRAKTNSTASLPAPDLSRSHSSTSVSSHASQSRPSKPSSRPSSLPVSTQQMAGAPKEERIDSGIMMEKRQS